MAPVSLGRGLFDLHTQRSPSGLYTQRHTVMNKISCYLIVRYFVDHPSSAMKVRFAKRCTIQLPRVPRVYQMYSHFSSINIDLVATVQTTSSCDGSQKRWKPVQCRQRWVQMSTAMKLTRPPFEPCYSRRSSSSTWKVVGDAKVAQATVVGLNRHSWIFRVIT